MIQVYMNILEVSIIFFANSKVLHLEQLITRLFVQNTGIVSKHVTKTYRRLTKDGGKAYSVASKTAVFRYSRGEIPKVCRNAR